MNIVIDIGNTRSKLGIFDQRELIKTETLENTLLVKVVSDFLRHEPYNIAISSVEKDAGFIENLNVAYSLTVSADIPLPISIDYDTPETLGSDRICGCVGAKTRYPSDHVLIIDAGSCITYDLVTDKGRFIGGGISPGYSMRLRSMHDYTSRLPLIDPSDQWYDYGTSTAGSILFGAAQGIAIEINGIIRQFQSHFANLKVILTGGDAHYFEQHIENPIFAGQNLVLEGLNEILMHNMSLDD